MQKEISFADVARASTQTLVDYTRQTFINAAEVPQPRSVMAVNVATRLMFDDYSSMEQPFQKISSAIQIMLACNDYCDLGVAAERRRKNGKLTQEQFIGLVSLQSALRQKLDNAIETYGGTIDRFLIEEYIQDSVALAKCHDLVLPEDIPLLLELDSAIFEFFSLAAVNEPRIRQYMQYADGDNPLEKLTNKYCKFLEVAPNPDPDLFLLRALHIGEMLLKLQDDKLGSKEDALLNLKSFDEYVGEFSPEQREKLFAELRSKYLKELKQLGFSELSAITAETLFTVVQKMKFQFMTANETVDDSIDRVVMPQMPPRDHLRESLYASGHLHDLFKTPQLIQDR